MTALAGIRVLDLADESGAYCGKLLADAGADVVKIEPPGGDPAREIGPFYEDRAGRERSLFFWHYNANKRSAVLDLADGAQRDKFAALADAADVLLLTGTPGHLGRHGLDYETLAASHPHLVVAIVSPFGQSGPRAEWRSSDIVAQALGGMIFVSGHPGEAPLSALGLQAYHSAALHAATGVVLALLARERTQRGQLVDVSLQESVAAAVEHVSAAFHESRRIEVRRGTLHWTRTFRVGRCRDGAVLLSHLGDWTSLIEWVKADGAARDLAGPEWEDFAHRRDHCEHVFEVLDAWARRYRVDALVAGAQLRRLPYAPVLPLASVAAHPQLRQREFFAPLEHDDLGAAVVYPGSPCHFGAIPWRPGRRPPLLGEHTREVLAGASARSPAFAVGEGRERRGEPPATPHPSPLRRPVRERESIGPATGATVRQGESSTRVLGGVRILDFTWVVAGPVATRVLADHGADVIKIERPGTVVEGSRRGGLFGNLNRGKRSVVINMADPRGVDLARELARRSDVVIDNFSPRAMTNWGLDYDALRGLKADIIAVSMSGFGRTGPCRDHVAYGPTLQAQAGYTYHMRHPGGEPAGWGFSYADMVSGYSAALAVLVALLHRDRTGAGQRIDFSQFEALAAVIGPALLDVLNGGEAPAAFGNRSQERPAAPHGVYRCRDLTAGETARDRWCAIAVFGDAGWQRFVAAIGRPRWTREGRFATLSQRLENWDALDRLVESWTARHEAELVMERLQAAGIAAGIVSNARDLCARDEHLKARAYWSAACAMAGEEFTFDGVSARLSQTPGRVAAPGPQLGEHTGEVLRKILAIDAAAIARLRAEQVVA